MKKTISITLAGIIFNIEEDGYNKLKSYLDSIRDNFSSLSDKDEVLNDIEARAAEKFSERITPSKQVITVADVEELMASMGTIEDIAGEEKAETREADSKATSWKEKKFYRDPDNAMIMGVAAGLASYFGIDPVIVRLVFVVSLFFGGVGIIVYLILCLIMPEAKTTAQKMEMRGQPVNLASLKDAAEEKIETAKSKIKLGQPIRRLIIMLGSLAKKIGMVLSVLVGLGIIIVSLVVIIGIFFTVGNLLFNANSAYIDFPVRDFLPGVNYFIAVSAGFLTVFIPAAGVFFVGLSLVKRRLVMNLLVGLMLLSIWVISLATLGVYAVRVMPQLEERERVEEQAEKISKSYDFRDFNSIRASGNYTINVVKGDDYKVEVTGSSVDLESTEIALVGSELRIEEGKRDKICIFCFDSSHKRTITVTMPELSKFFADGIVRSDVSGFSGEKMDIGLNGATKTTADINVKNVSVKVDGVSKLFLSGAGESLVISTNGAASADVDEFEVKMAKVEADGSSKINVWATERLDVRADGASKVYFIGDPQVTKKIDGASRVQKSD